MVDCAASPMTAVITAEVVSRAVMLKSSPYFRISAAAPTPRTAWTTIRISAVDGTPQTRSISPSINASPRSRTTAMPLSTNAETRATSRITGFDPLGSLAVIE